MNVPVYQGQSHVTSMIAFYDKMTEFVDEGTAVMCFTSTQQGFHCFLPSRFCIKLGPSSLGNCKVTQMVDGQRDG